MTSLAQRFLGVTMTLDATTIDEIVDLTFPGSKSVESLDDTTHDNNPVIVMTSQPGRVKYEAFDVKINWIPGNTGHQNLRDSAGSIVALVIAFTFPNGTTSTNTFNAFLTSFSFDSPAGQIITATASFEPTGEVNPVIT